jgi:3-oxoacyl-[acyl-carrier protein] reductase
VGRAIAIELARAGADVVVHGRTGGSRFEAIQALIAECGQRAAFVAADLAERGSYERLVDSAWNCFGRIDIWVNNAGADVLTGDAAHWSFERKLEHLWLVDVRGTIEISRLVGQRMQQLDCAGALINIGWDQAEQGMAGDSGEMFAATKGAIMAFTRSLAQSLAPKVRVNCVAPGWIRTAWGEQASEYWQERATRESLVQRWGTPEDVARAVCFLSSPAAEFITGQTVHVNGGFRYGGTTT